MIRDLQRDAIQAGEMVGTARVLSVRGTRLPEMPKGKPLIEVFAAEDMAKDGKQQRKRSAGELRYEEFLVMAQAAGIVRYWLAEPFKIDLAPHTTYKPDFFVVLADGRPCLIEIKGHWKWDDAKVKVKIARQYRPEYHWLCLEYKAKAWRVIFKNGREPVELIP